MLTVTPQFSSNSLHGIAQWPHSMCRCCWSRNCYCIILQWSKSTVEHSSRCAVQDMLKSRELAEQMTGWQSNHHIIMACILEDLKSWGGFDATCVPVGTKLRILHYWSPAGKRCKNRKCSAWPSPLKGWVWAAASHMTVGTASMATNCVETSETSSH